ncbi:MAG: haloacid dehalogenase-like hydrolase [Bacteroidales bacterium]|jgi:phosphoserine phosphatase|nr:haloacid dehalogenase-like hydrolase [Bacteroidales bacterium]
MNYSNTTVAICYDFDGTLAPGNMQEHSYIPNLGIANTDFWDQANQFAKQNDMNEILAYMWLLLEKSRQKNLPIRKADFVNHGKNIPLYPGVEGWFERINNYGETLGLDINHFIISSGLREMVEGTKIAPNFSFVFASGYYYNEDGIAEWPSVGIDYTGKTQFLFRINKGIFNFWDSSIINKYMPENLKPFPFERFIYIGDGETDVPAMKMVNYQGGYTIAVFDSQKSVNREGRLAKDVSLELLRQGRARYVAPADYRDNSDLDKLLTNILNDIRFGQNLKEHNGKFL